MLGTLLPQPHQYCDHRLHYHTNLMFVPLKQEGWRCRLWYRACSAQGRASASSSSKTKKQVTTSSTSAPVSTHSAVFSGIAVCSVSVQARVHAHVRCQKGKSRRPSPLLFTFLFPKTGFLTESDTCWLARPVRLKLADWLDCLALLTSGFPSISAALGWWVDF